MEKLQAFVDEREEQEKARLDAMVVELLATRTAHKVRKRTYLPLGTKVYVRATAGRVYHRQDQHLYRLVDRQKLPDTATGFIVGVRFLAEGLYCEPAAKGEDEVEPAFLDTYRAVPVYLVVRTLFVKPIQVLLDDVMEVE